MNRNQAIQSVKAFLPKEPAMESVIKYCDLHPTQNSWRKWTDNLGNFLQIYHNRKFISFRSNPQVIEEKIVTDLHHHAHPEKIAGISKRAFVAKTDQGWLGWFLGEDRLRLVTYKDGWTKNYPVMTCGINSVLPIIKFLEGTTEGKADILSLGGPTSEKIEASWVFNWPPHDFAKKQIQGFPLC